METPRAPGSVSMATNRGGSTNSAPKYSTTLTSKWNGGTGWLTGWRWMGRGLMGRRTGRSQLNKIVWKHPSQSIQFTFTPTIVHLYAQRLPKGYRMDLETSQISTGAVMSKDVRQFSKLKWEHVVSSCLKTLTPSQPLCTVVTLVEYTTYTCFLPTP